VAALLSFAGIDRAGKPIYNAAKAMTSPDDEKECSLKEDASPTEEEYREQLRKELLSGWQIRDRRNVTATDFRGAV
jgi:hypothetical protein